MHTIYRITNKINLKHYVGQAKNLNKRWSGHKGLARKVGCKDYKYKKYIQVIHYAISKYGIDNFEFIVLEECDAQEKANEKESYWVGYYNSLTPNGYNITPGGKVVSGPAHPSYGRQLNNEEKENLSRKLSGRKLSKETKEKIKQAHLGRVFSEESKKRMSAGKLNSDYIATEEHRRKISDSHYRPGYTNSGYFKIGCIPWKTSFKKGNIPHNKMSDENIQKMIQLKLEGKTRKEIAEIIGCHFNLISKYTKHIGK